MSDQPNNPPSGSAPDDPPGQGSTPPWENSPASPPGSDQGWGDSGGSATSPDFGPPPNYGQPGYGEAAYGQPGMEPEKTSGMAVTALVLGILGLLASITLVFFFVGGPLGLVALILGIIAITKIKPGSGLKGKGMAIAGAITGGLGLLVAIGITILGVSVFQSGEFQEMLDSPEFQEELERQLEDQEGVDPEDLEDL